MTLRGMLAAACAFAATLAGAEGLAPPSSLRVEGVPPIPVETARQAHPYGEFTVHAMLSWHPQRREMLVRRRHGATGQVHLVAAPGATPQPLTAFDDPVVHAEYQPGKGDYFVFTRASAGDEIYRLYRQGPGTGAATPITPAGERVAAFAWSPRGDRLLYATQRGAGDDARTVLSLVDPLHAQAVRVLATFGHGHWSDFRFSRDGRRLAFVERVSPAESHVWVIDTASGARGRVTPVTSGNPVSYASPQFSRDGRGLFVLSDRDSQFRHLAFLPLGPGREKPLAAAHDYDVDAFELAWDPNRIAFTTNEAGTDVLRFMDAGTFTELPRPPLFDAVIDGLQWRPGSDEVAFHVSSARTAGDVFTYQLAANRLTRWTNGNNAEVNTRELAEPQLVRWKSFDGREITGYLYAPPARFTGPRPVMVMLHGGPSLEARPEFIGRYNYLVNELGVALVYPNVRGSSGFGKTFLALDDGRHREDAARDVGALLDWIAGRGDLDAKRVIVAGASYGGYLALAATAAHPDRVAGTIVEMGISDFVSFLERTPAWRRQQRRAEYGDERDPATRAWLASISPLAHVDRLRHPVLVAQGVNDARVPSTQSEELVAALRKQGTPVWYLAARDEGHGFVRKANAEYLFLAIVEFARSVLKP
ncbi:MAG TPA: alpha/beta fold hydrolase [Usitatibacter sp.]|nr:alpha/beta fold hydrolase [Usitatibacter sp.]